MNKILIIRLSSIGDIVLSSPLLRAIKAQKPALEIHFLTKKMYKPVLQHNPYIDKLILLENDISGLVKEMKKEKYDYIIDLHKNLRTFRIKKGLNVPANSYEKLNWEKWLMVKFKINNLPHKHIVQRYFDTLAPIGVVDDAQGLEYYNGLNAQSAISALPQELGSDFAVLVIGGTYFTKQIPLSKALEITEKVRIPVVIVGGPNDYDMAQEIIEKARKKVYNTAGKANLNESAEIIRRSSFVITADTGMMHIAAAYQKKIYSLWGNTIPEFGMTPYMPQNPERSIILENKLLSCRPCSKLGFKECPKSHFECMEALNLDGVWE